MEEFKDSCGEELINFWGFKILEVDMTARRELTTEAKQQMHSHNLERGKRDVCLDISA